LLHDDSRHRKKIRRDAKKRNVVDREEVETRKIGRNETRTFQGLFRGCTRVSKKPGKEPDINVSFPMKLAWQADCMFLLLRWKRNTWISKVSFGFPPFKESASQEIFLRISPDHGLVGATTEFLIGSGVRVQIHGIPVQLFAI
jgi:hypothetical protein